MMLSPTRSAAEAQADSSPATISIVLCTHGRCTALQATLASLAQVRVPAPWQVDLMVVENGAKGGAEAIAAAFEHERIRARYLFFPVANKSHALNGAIADSTSGILLFTDDDVRLPREWIVEMCTPLARGEGEVVVGGARLAPHLQRGWMQRYHRGFLASTEYLSDTAPSEFAGINMACLRTVFGKVQGFDPELGGGGLGNCEDSLLGRQFRHAGLAFVSRTKVWVEHHPAESRLLYASWIKAAQSVGRSRAYLQHHWYHERIRGARARLLYFRLKLRLRLLLQPARTAQSEGIAAWELSYRVDIAKLSHYLHECRRPRNYERQGLRKLRTSPQPIAA